MSATGRPAGEERLPTPLADLRAAATSDTFRDSVWRMLGASVSESIELLAYARSTFDWGRLARGGPLPWPDAPGVSDWQRYAEEAASLGVFAALRRRLVQLQFPVEEGISATDDYVRATRRGIPPTNGGVGLQLRRPEQLRLFLHPTAAGRVPVIVAADREDFVTLVRALTCRNEPKPVIDAMGACSVTGYNNWDRVRAAYARQAWMLGEGQSFSHFVGTISAKKELYQDRFLLLSRGPYSNVASSELGLSQDEWLRRSGLIRLEHECAHYLTLRFFGTMRNSLLDELIADYMGIVAAEGQYRPEWFLRFMGPEHDGRGGRLPLYRGTPPLSEGAFRVLRSAIRTCAEGLATLEGWRGSAVRKTRALLSVAAVGLEGLASVHSGRLLAEAWRAVEPLLSGARGDVRNVVVGRAAPRVQRSESEGSP